MLRIAALICWLVVAPFVLFQFFDALGRWAPLTAAFVAGVAIFFFHVPVWLRAAGYVVYGFCFGMGMPLAIIAIACGLFHDCP